MLGPPQYPPPVISGTAALVCLALWLAIFDLVVWALR